MSETPLALVLLDRDGTLNVKAEEGRYVTEAADLVLLPGAAEAVRRLNASGARVAVVTNQRAVARGLLTAERLDELHAVLAEQLAAADAHVDAVYSCPHEIGACECRKPQPGMLRSALRDFAVAPSQAVMIGDADSDVQAGRGAAVRTIQLTTTPEQSAADATAPDLLSAVDALLGNP